MATYWTTDTATPPPSIPSGERQKAVESARGKVAAALGARPEEIHFTSGGTEADNWAIKAVAELKKNKGKHIISTPIEHHAVLHTLKYLEKQGYEVTYLDVDGSGNISLDALKAAIRPDTILITVMMANNEIGTVEPVAEIGRSRVRLGCCSIRTPSRLRAISPSTSGR
jgi:cysteine desulfurase